MKAKVVNFSFISPVLISKSISRCVVCRSLPGELDKYSAIIKYGACESGKEKFCYDLVCCVSEDLKEFLF